MLDAAALVAITRRLDALESRERIRELLFEFVRGVERGDVDIIRGVFHPDARTDYGIFVGNAQEFATHIVDWYRDVPYVRNFVTNPRIVLDGDRAFVESHFDSTNWLELEDGGMIERCAEGRYTDVFERRDGQWRILHRRALNEKHWTRPVSAKELGRRGQPAGRQSTTLVGTRDRSDPSYLGFAVANELPAPFAATPHHEASAAEWSWA
ncbi:nuclear transport factor 2 family protein [Rhodococcus koreensis]